MSHRSQVRFTYEDYVLFPDDGKRHEIINGEHYVTPSPSTRHQTVALRVATAIENVLQQTRLGRLFIAPCDVVLSEVDVVQPDLLFVSSSRESIITPENIRGVPDLVVEIISDSSRKTDEVVKRKLYQKYGVGEYWIIDPALEVIKVYRLAESGYIRVGELSSEAGDLLTSPLLSGLRVSLDTIFRTAHPPTRHPAP